MNSGPVDILILQKFLGPPVEVGSLSHYFTRVFTIPGFLPSMPSTPQNQQKCSASPFFIWKLKNLGAAGIDTRHFSVGVGWLDPVLLDPFLLPRTLPSSGLEAQMSWLVSLFLNDVMMATKNGGVTHFPAGSEEFARG